MIMCVLLCYPVSIHMSQLLSTGRPISSCISYYLGFICINVPHCPKAFDTITMKCSQDWNLFN